MTLPPGKYRIATSKRMAPQVGLEPTTLRLTARFWHTCHTRVNRNRLKTLREGNGWVVPFWPELYPVHAHNTRTVHSFVRSSPKMLCSARCEKWTFARFGSLPRLNRM